MSFLVIYYYGFIVLEEVIVEVIPSSAGSIDVSDGVKAKSMKLPMSVSSQLDHIHNVYIAIGTLTCALLIVASIVSIMDILTFTNLAEHLFGLYMSEIKDWYLQKNNNFTITQHNN